VVAISCIRHSTHRQVFFRAFWETCPLAKIPPESVRKPGGSAISKPASESITRRLAPILWTASRIECTVSSTERSRGRRSRISFPVLLRGFQIQT
jgi:hypothetical protein